MLTRGGEIGQLRPIAVNDFLIVEQIKKYIGMVETLYQLTPSLSASRSWWITS